MTKYAWEHLVCNGCGLLHTTKQTVNGKAIPGVISATAAGWVYKVATTTKPRRDYCPDCIKKGWAV